MAKVYLISCRDAGVNCDFQARGSSVDEAMQVCADHGIKEHNVMNRTGFVGGLVP